MGLNLGTGGGHSVHEVIRALETVSGRCMSFETNSRQEGDPPVLVADATELRRCLGSKARFTDLTGIVGTAMRCHTRCWVSERYAGLLHVSHNRIGL